MFGHLIATNDEVTNFLFLVANLSEVETRLLNSSKKFSYNDIILSETLNRDQNTRNSMVMTLVKDFEVGLMELFVDRDSGYRP